MDFLVETYPSKAARRSDVSVQRVRARLETRAIQFRGRLVVPADETEFWPFDAASMVEVAGTLRVAGSTTAGSSAQASS